MSEASVSIAEAKSSPVGRLTYRVLVKGPDGQPLAGEEVPVTLQGDGSLQSGFSVKELKVETDAEGRAQVIWYRRSIYDRDVRATLSVAAPRTDCTVALEPVTDDPRSEDSWISFAPFRLRRPR